MAKQQQGPQALRTLTAAAQSRKSRERQGRGAIQKDFLCSEKNGDD